MISAYAQAVRDECWWHGCRLPGAQIDANFGEDQDYLVRLCGLHAQVVQSLLEAGGYDVELWISPSGQPVLFATRPAA
jgi:hypothetical protein